VIPLDNHLRAQRDAIAAAGLHRALRRIDKVNRPEIHTDNRPVVDFSSNDYLGLAKHPAVCEAAARAAWDFGAGSGASRLISGNFACHEDLEEALAAFKNRPAAVTFSSGYAAALGTLPALVGPNDVVILDKLCHACLVDGIRLSRATIRVFPHNHCDRLEHLLAWARKSRPNANILVVVESIYSMDGDAAPLDEIVALKQRFGAWLFVDEAHAVGVVGPRGRGLGWDKAERVDIHMGTLGKALGASGAYVAGSTALRDHLINRARSMIFSTSPSPPSVAAARAALGVLESDEGRHRVDTLAARCQLFAAEAARPSQSAIFPILVGDERAAMASSDRLREAGFAIPGIRFPTVPRGTARLRATISATHSESQIQAVAAALRAEHPTADPETTSVPTTSERTGSK
jgi:8-amino-7-oxononanoate synthase